MHLARRLHCTTKSFYRSRTACGVIAMPREWELRRANVHVDESRTQCGGDYWTREGTYSEKATRDSMICRVLGQVESTECQSLRRGIPCYWWTKPELVAKGSPPRYQSLC